MNGNFVIEGGVLKRYTGGTSETVVVPCGVSVLGERAFSGAAVGTVLLPSTLRRIEAGAFAGAKVCRITIPDGLEYIGPYAFSCCNRLEEFPIPEHAVIEDGAFFACPRWEDADGYVVVRGVLHSYAPDELLTIPEGVERIPADLCHRDARVERLVLPASLREIGAGAFRECMWLEQVTFPQGSGRVIIGAEAFRDCLALKSMNLPESAVLDPGAFSGCSNLPHDENGLLILGGVLWSVSLVPPTTMTKVLSVPPEVTRIELSNGLIRRMGWWEDVSLTAAQWEGLTAAVRNSLVTMRAAEAFLLRKEAQSEPYAKTVRHLLLRKNTRGKFLRHFVDENEAEALAALLEIQTKSLTIDETDALLSRAGSPEVRSLLLTYKNHFTQEEIAENDTIRLEKELGIRERSVAEWRKILFILYNKRGTIDIRGQKAEAETVHIPERIGKKAVTGIKPHAFAGRAIRAVLLPETLDTIGAHAFENCTELSQIQLPSGIKAVPKEGFSGCTALRAAALPSECNTIRQAAFQGCAELKTLFLPKHLRTIGREAFLGSGLEELHIPEGCKSLGERAFAGCKALRDIWIPGSVNALGEALFDGCRDLTIYAPAGSPAARYAALNDLRWEENE